MAKTYTVNLSEMYDSVVREAKKKNVSVSEFVRNSCKVQIENNQSLEVDNDMEMTPGG